MYHELDSASGFPDVWGAVPMPGKREREIRADREQLAARIAERFKKACQEAVDARGRFHVALSGGRTPRRAYELMGELKGVPWGQVELYMGDERSVPLNHEQSNYRMVKESLLFQVEDLVGHVHSINPHEKSLEDVASGYESKLRDYLGPEGVFDLVLVGVGPDGSTASLFPGRREAALDPDRLVVPVTDSPDGLDRVSLSAGALHRAREVWVIATGEPKAEAVRKIIDGGVDPSEMPAAHVRDCPGDVVWFLDEASASGLAPAP